MYKWYCLYEPLSMRNNFVVKYLLTTVFTFTITGFGVLSAQAAIIGVSGNGIDQGSASGVNLDQGQTENNLIQGFDEIQNISISSNSVVLDYYVGNNLNVGDTFSGISTFDNNNGVFLESGRYNSHAIHFDPLGDSGGQQTNATFIFDGTIVGIIVSNSGDLQLLNDSNSIFGNANNYNLDVARRAENHDTFELIDSNILEVTFLGTRGNFVDSIRVVTAVPEPLTIVGVGTAVPEPLTIVGVGTAIAFGTGFKRKLTKAKNK